jgi:hypothetical protein
MHLNPIIWGPHFWFVLHTIAISYPTHPNSIIKKKYYEFIQNLPLFLPNNNISINFSKLLDKYPIKPYLDSRDDFIKWTYFIHNKINELLEKPLLTFEEFYVNYYEQYKLINTSNKEYNYIIKKIIYVSLLVITISFIVYLHNK